MTVDIVSFLHVDGRLVQRFVQVMAVVDCDEALWLQSLNINNILLPINVFRLGLLSAMES